MSGCPHRKEKHDETSRTSLTSPSAEPKRSGRVWVEDRFRWEIPPLPLACCAIPADAAARWLPAHLRGSPCTGYLGHPFKNKPFESEKDLLPLLANTGR